MRKTILLIIDGFGYREESYGNAIKDANMKTFNRLWNRFPHSILNASEHYVGLPDGQFGNSEVCHAAIGAGKKIRQDITIVSDAIKNKEIKDNQEFLNLINHVKNNNSRLHLMGLLSDGGVHSDIKYMKNLIPILKELGITSVVFHAITDGRDTDAKSSIKYLTDINNVLKENEIGYIGSVCGRYYAMDRDNNWDRTKQYYDLVMSGKGLETDDLESTINDFYDKNITDEFLPPILINANSIINDNDGLLWLNFRSDRTRQIIRSLTDKNFSEFETNKMVNFYVATMFEALDVHAPKLFSKDLDKSYSIGKYFSDLGLSQARIAETEKYAHVTYFFNGGIKDKLDGCDNFNIPSPKVATYDLKPEMSIQEVTETAISCIKRDYDFILINFANPDMVGHTGNYDAAVKALGFVDESIKKIYEEARMNEYTLLITSDHGNIDKMLNQDGTPITTHSISPVPFIYCMADVDLKETGDITMIAPTILKTMELDLPEEMKDSVSLFNETVYIPESHKKYDVIPDSRFYNYEVFADSFVEFRELRKIIKMEDQELNPYWQYRSYEDFFCAMDNLCDRFPDVKQIIMDYKEHIKKWNNKDLWGIVQFIGESDFEFTNGKHYYVPMCKENDSWTIAGIIDNEEYAPFLVWSPECTTPVDLNKDFKIIVDPSGQLKEMFDSIMNSIQDN